MCAFSRVIIYYVGVPLQFPMPFSVVYIVFDP